MENGSEINPVNSDDQTFFDDQDYGWCLLAKDEKSEVEYNFKTPLSLHEGSFTFWFRWLEPDATSFFNLARLWIKENKTFKPVLRIYLYPHSNLGFMVLRYHPREFNVWQRLATLKVQLDKWRSHPEEWHFVALTWNTQEGRLYLDGIMVDADPGFARIPLTFDRLVIGEPSCSYNNPKVEKMVTYKKYLIRDIKLYNFVIDPNVLCAEYQKSCGNLISKDNF
ncbi:MAG: LamG-like jellyroll fold domain-containing protein [Kiritimatiellia bacterium]|nr:LamG-like jellyroll fold domain-containing protein [Kiritimatiellia bacterium]